MTPETLAALLHEYALDVEHQRGKVLRLVLDVDDPAIVDCIGDAVEALMTSGMLLARARNMALGPVGASAGGHARRPWPEWKKKHEDEPPF